MLARQLDYAPTADELPFTAQVMTEDLAQHGLCDQDCNRVREAFHRLGPTIQRWPTARMVIEFLPPVELTHTLPKRPSPQRTRSIDDVMVELRRAISHKNKRNSVMLPGEGFGDFRRAYEQSNLTMEQFRGMRLNPPELKQIDPEAAAERAAIQAESDYR